MSLLTHIWASTQPCLWQQETEDFRSPASLQKGGKLQKSRVAPLGVQPLPPPALALSLPRDWISTGVLLQKGKESGRKPSPPIAKLCTILPQTFTTPPQPFRTISSCSEIPLYCWLSLLSSNSSVSQHCPMEVGVEPLYSAA